MSLLRNSLANELRSESEAISNALDDFLRERNAASQMQAEALAIYEAEMADIGDISDEEDELEDDINNDYNSDMLAPKGGVDHNVRRLAKQSNDSEELDNEDDYDDDYGYDDEFEDDDR